MRRGVPAVLTTSAPSPEGDARQQTTLFVRLATCSGEIETAATRYVLSVSLIAIAASDRNAADGLVRTLMSVRSIAIAASIRNAASILAGSNDHNHFPPTIHKPF